MSNQEGDQYPLAPLLRTNIHLGPILKTSPITSLQLSYLSKDPILTILLAAQHPSSKAGLTRLTFCLNPWVLTHSDRETTFQRRTTWMRILTPWSQHQERRTIPSRYQMGHHSMDRHIVVQTATRKGSETLTGTSHRLNTRIMSSNRILQWVINLWQSRHRRHRQ